MHWLAGVVGGGRSGSLWGRSEVACGRGASQ